MPVRALAFSLLSVAAAAAVAGSMEHRVTGSVWEGRAQVARFDFTAVPGRPARMTLAGGRELEVVVAGDGSRTVRLLDGSGGQLHSATVPPSGPADRTFRYLFCGAALSYASPEPASMPECPPPAA